MSRGSEWRRWDLHVHTASSEDHKYKANDSDSLLVESWRKNKIEAVAVTDHFIIDSERIKNLKKLAPEITIFPGVELRTDKGSTNIHVIIIFSNDIDIEELSADFDAIMIRDKAKNCDKFDSIYWDYADIVEFSQKRNGIITIHTGSKVSGLDEEIRNDSLFKMAIKTEYAESVDIFEVRNKKDVESYLDIVFKNIDERPVIVCSDNHDPRNYDVPEKLWIKGDRSFKGLLQAIEQPSERVFVGDEPQKISHEKAEAQYIIDSIKINKKSDALNLEEWFNTELQLNSSLVSVIGNKGSGKSALSDILGLLGGSLNLDESVASFLNIERFNRPSKYFARDYEAQITWLDGYTDKVNSIELSNANNKSKVQYLPQKYIENICSNLDDGFQKEINSVLFSYLDDTDKMETRTFEEFIEVKTEKINVSIESFKEKLKKINKKIIELEGKKEKIYVDNLKKRQKELLEELERQLSQKPKEIKEPNDTATAEVSSNIEIKAKEIEELQNEIDKVKEELKVTTKRMSDVEIVKSKIKIEMENIKAINEEVKTIFKNVSDIHKYTISASSPISNIDDYILQLSNESDANKSSLSSLLEKEAILINEKNQLIEKSTSDVKEYQKYIQELKEWNNKINSIKSDENSEDTLEYIESEIDYIENKVDEDYVKCIKDRKEVVESIYLEKTKIMDIYKDIYSPIDNELRNILTDLDNGISFSATLSFDAGTKKILNNINKQLSSLFMGVHNANNQMDMLIREVDANELDSVVSFTEKFIDGCMKSDEEETEGDFSKLNKVIRDKEKVYSELFGLDFISVDYSLTLDGKELSQLSPGERGLVLLIFYLVLSKDSIPIVIDQPEDNLDNQSIYSKLVPCIREAKKKRQVVLVTHNPNIAVACDSEQVIVASIDKVKSKINYEAGSIENVDMNKQLVDVLEGTYPAFNLRERKYILE
ncbi:TrlF family AAA-like ATPase [Vagococcus fluvialis]|uniref:TrlF family AAA-like ATPase n=1 Tax=Vagococcus fluvialis TaxID=2738 RepID=UPI0032E39743